MSRSPLAIIIPGYGLAAATAVASAAAGAGVLASLLLFWLGGAVFTLALGVARRGRDEAPRQSLEDEDRALAQALAAWEQDRRAEAEAAQAAAVRDRRGA